MGKIAYRWSGAPGDCGNRITTAILLLAVWVCLCDDGGGGGGGSGWAVKLGRVIVLVNGTARRRTPNRNPPTTKLNEIKRSTVFL